jgi:hypothetical protein
VLGHHDHRPMNLPTAGAQGFLMYLTLTGHNPPRGCSADWWTLTIANAAGTNGLMCLLMHGRARDNKFLVTHPITDQRFFTSTIAEAHWPWYTAMHRTQISYLYIDTVQQYTLYCCISYLYTVVYKYEIRVMCECISVYTIELAFPHSL